MGELVCCESPMEFMEEKTEEEGKEKHTSIIEETEEGIKPKAGNVPHPMKKIIRMMDRDSCQ